MSEQGKKQFVVTAGCGPPFPVDGFLEPLRTLTPKKRFAILGPAIIALGGTIGGGERLIGPPKFVKYGLALVWITAISALLQVFLDLDSQLKNSLSSRRYIWTNL